MLNSADMMGAGGMGEVYRARDTKLGRGHVQISSEGGTLPRWRSDGRELFYKSGDKLMAVDIELGAEVRAGLPRELFEGSYGLGFDVAPDGKRFLMIKNVSSLPSAPPNQLTFVVNWFEELKARVPAK